jgi:DNA-binding MarR family transcriptional regulator
MKNTLMNSKDTRLKIETLEVDEPPTHLNVKTWLRLYACSNLIEQQIQQRLRGQFGITLARFDFLAQLVKAPNGMKMNALSKKLMVSGGNITGLTDQLVKEELVLRQDDANDRRSYVLICTEKGRREFTTMAQAHESWIGEIMGNLDSSELKRLYSSLDQLRNMLAPTNLT